jgi:hypothetical protein
LRIAARTRVAGLSRREKLRESISTMGYFWLIGYMIVIIFGETPKNGRIVKRVDSWSNDAIFKKASAIY